MSVSRTALRSVCAAAALILGASIAWAQAGDGPNRQRDRRRDASCLEPSAGTTLENLQAAYAGESNARERYLAYAKKADEEGFGAVASLLRATARAEDVHARNHAEVIRKLGAEPRAEIAKVEVKTTRENLEEALKGENHERLTMYPEFITRAESDRNSAATKTFKYAKRAEEEHAVLFEKVLTKLDDWKGAKRDFYVCSVCGFTTAKLDFKKCVSCFAAVEKYEKVN